MILSFDDILVPIATLIIGLAASNAALSATNDPLLSSTERSLQSVYEAASPAIVQLVGLRQGRERQLGCGIIVTREGHIVTQGDIVRLNPKETPLSVHLPDGRRVEAVALGWSGEWNIGVLKLSGEKPWPHVPLSKDLPSIRASQYCVAIGYPNYGHNDPRPAMRFGCITKSASQTWCTSSCPVWIGDFGTCLFDLQGRFLGVCAKIPTDDDALYTPIHVIKQHWNDLIAGKNLDEVRLSLTDERSPLRAGDPSRNGEPTSQTGADVSGIERAIAATVRIVPNKKNADEGENSGWSGVIITSDGYIATCAHHMRLPGAEVTVRLPDGRTAAGRVLGMNWLTDVGLVKLLGDGPWPYAETGDSTSMSNNDACTIMGYPHSHRGNQPLLRKTHVIPDPEMPEGALSSRMRTDRTASCEMTGGDSGGGLFDEEGRLIAVHKVVSPNHEHVRIECFRLQWEALVAAQPVDEMSCGAQTALVRAFRSAAGTNSATAIVEILRDNEPRAIGVIVKADGRILTKASELYGDIACRMSDRAVYPAIVEKVNREHDLGLIRVKANDLVTAKWTQSEQITVGALVAAILPSNELRVGIVSQSARAIPAERGFMGGLRDGDRGLKLYDDTTLRAYNLPLHKNDVILRVEDRPTPDLKTYQQLMEADDRAPLAVTGDPVSVDIQRGSEMLHLRFPLGPMNWPRPWGETESRRFSGFPGVLDTDLPLATTQCGAPLVDSTGGTAAIVIACRTRGRTHIIPAAVARAFISD